MTVRQLLFTTFAAVFVLLIGATRTRSEGIVEIHLRGKFYTEPATVRMTVTVEPAAENRSLVVQADGERLFRSSEVPLEGERGQRLHTVEFKNLPSGQYILRAEVHSSGEVRATAEDYVTVGDPGER